MQQNLSNGQTLRQEQTLAPQQIQSLEVLTAPLLELEHTIAHELENNPVLELAEPDGGDLPAELPDGSPDDADGEMSAFDDQPLDANREDFEDSLTHLLEDSGGWDSLSASAASSEDEKRRNYLFDSLESEQSLQEDLLEQLRLSDVPDELKPAAEEIIGSLDGRGYLVTAPADIAQACGVTLAQVEQALHMVQSFDPPGIAARDPGESLLLQLKRQGRESSPEAELVRAHFSEILHNKLPQVADEMGLTLDELNALLGKLRRLNPNPAAAAPSGGERPVYVVPEVTVVEDGDEFKVIPNRERTPRLLLSRHYLKMLTDPDVPEEAKSYIRQKTASAKLLMRALEQRTSTIVRIAELIVSMQYDFLKRGPEYLKPMTMLDIAEKLGLHETTISRAMANKYMQTPKGLYEFKFFFTGGFRASNGEEMSSRGIKSIIREAVDGENPASPLSDSKIMQILHARGFDVARRTIAKYREELGIQSSQLRKVF